MGLPSRAVDIQSSPATAVILMLGMVGQKMTIAAAAATPSFVTGKTTGFRRCTALKGGVTPLTFARWEAVTKQDGKDGNQ